MFERISASWQLVLASWDVLRSDKELIVFPIVSSIAALIVMVTFAVPMFAAGMFDAMANSLNNPNGVLSFVVAFLFYLVLYSVIFFFNTALVGAALIRINGGDPTLRDGFRIAGQRVGKIIGYALISATVGMIARVLAQRGGVVGQILSSIVGLAWSVASFLVVPILVTEDVGPIEAVTRSTQLLKKTWGEQIVGGFSIGMIFGLLTLAVILAGGALAIFASSIHSSALMVAIIIATVLVIVALNLVSAALSGIFQAALYRYATQGDASSFFAPELIAGAFKAK
jgi:hypothetical protein